MNHDTPGVLVVMGVSGSGKTTLGRALAERFQIPFFDGDDYHPRANIDKMARGSPLSDSDRGPWLARLRSLIQEQLRLNGAIVACSALKQAYRDRLANPRVEFVYLEGSYQLIHERLSTRSGHFMRTDLLRTQFETLEPPQNAIRVDVLASTDEQVEHVVERLAERGVRFARIS